MLSLIRSKSFISSRQISSSVNPTGSVFMSTQLKWTFKNRLNNYFLYSRTSKPGYLLQPSLRRFHFHLSDKVRSPHWMWGADNFLAYKSAFRLNLMLECANIHLNKIFVWSVLQLRNFCYNRSSRSNRLALSDSKIALHNHDNFGWVDQHLGIWIHQLELLKQFVLLLNSLPE